MELKPQELLVLLKVAANPQQPWTYAALAQSLLMSPAEVHASVKRAMVAGLAMSPSPRNWVPVRSAILEFAVHGARYSFPAITGPVKRGVLTAFGAPPLAGLIRSAAGEAPVWPHIRGTAKGPSLSPIYRTAPQAALLDARLYEALILLDALRMGRARERVFAQQLLAKLLGLSDAA